MTQQATALDIVRSHIKSEQTMGRMMIALKHETPTVEAKNQVKQYQASVLQTIEKTVGTDKDLSTKNPHSIVQCMIDAAQFRMMIDGRQHAHLVPYGNAVTLQIGYRGYLAKIKEIYPDADFTVEPIYKGDELKVWHDEDGAHYSLEKNNVFASGEQDFEGVLFAVKYTDNGRLVSKVVPVPKERIDRARKAAKQDFVWRSDYIEKAKAAAIKNACKNMFASITTLQEMVNYDNDKHHDPNKGQKNTAARSLLDNLNSSIDETLPKREAPKEPENNDDGDIEGDFSVVEDGEAVIV